MISVFLQIHMLISGHFFGDIFVFSFSKEDSAHFTSDFDVYHDSFVFQTLLSESIRLVPLVVLLRNLQRIFVINLRVLETKSYPPDISFGSFR